jgi:hypothetical protein
MVIPVWFIVKAAEWNLIAKGLSLHLCLVTICLIIGAPTALQYGLRKLLASRYQSLSPQSGKKFDRFPD